MGETSEQLQKSLSRTNIIRWLSLIPVLFGIAAIIMGGIEYSQKQEILASYQDEVIPFNPFDETAAFDQNSYQSLQVVFLTYEFASDFKDEYYYHIAFDEDGYTYIVKLRSDEVGEYQELIDALYSEEAAIPEPVEFKGVSGVIEPDIRDFAIESMNYMYETDSINEDNYSEFLGEYLLDTTQTPKGSVDLSAAYLFMGMGGFVVVLGLIMFVFQTRKIKTLQMEPIQADDRPQISLEPPKPSNPFFGVIGALGGSLVGVALWILIGRLGFIAGIAGFVMLKFALKGYEKLGGRLDKKGAVISLIIAALMITGANVADYLLQMFQAYLSFEVSFETILFVLKNFTNIMTEYEMWGGFMANLIVGYLLSIWSSFSMIKAILTYRDE